MTAPFDPASTRVPIPGTSNVRDLGGYPARDGRTVQKGRFLRSEGLSYPGADEALGVWDVAHADHFARLGLRTVIDLRAPKELEVAPSAWREVSGVHVVSMPVLEGGEGSATYVFGDLLTGVRTSFRVPDMVDLYTATLLRQSKVLGDVVRVLADSEATPALVHCSAGKDRTGVIVAMVLDVLGVPRDLVVSDYALTQRFRPNRVELHSAKLDSLGIPLDAVRVLFEAPPEAMEATLAHVDEEYGGSRSYFLEQCGLVPADLQALERNLLGPATR